MLRKRVLGGLLAFLLLPPSFAEAQGAEDEDRAVTRTRFGTLTVVDDESDPFLHTLTLDGKEIHRYDGLAMSVDAVYSIKRRDIALVARGSGGTACPQTFVIVQLEAKKPPLLSEEFGTCSDLAEPRLENDALIIEMPNYANHPELWDEKELEEAINTKRIYTWANGKLTEKRVKN